MALNADVLLVGLESALAGRTLMTLTALGNPPRTSGQLFT